LGKEAQRCDPSSAQDHKGVWGICPQRPRRHEDTEKRRRKRGEYKERAFGFSILYISFLILIILFDSSIQGKKDRITG